MKSIERRSAIGVIYSCASKRGWDDDVLHDYLREWGFGDDPHLSAMSPQQLSQVLRCFDVHRFVDPDKTVLYINSLARKAGRDYALDGIIRAKFGKDSIWALKKPQQKQLIAILNGYREARREMPEM